MTTGLVNISRQMGQMSCFSRLSMMPSDSPDRTREDRGGQGEDGGGVPEIKQNKEIKKKKKKKQRGVLEA